VFGRAVMQICRDLIRVGSAQQNMAGPAPQMKVAPKADSTKLSLPQQYARVRNNPLYLPLHPLRTEPCRTPAVERFP